MRIGSEDEGCVLHEFLINDITDGAGIFENKYGKFKVKSGSVIFHFPGVWRRYKPKLKTGWVENYVEFEGKIAKEFFHHLLFTSKKPVLQIGIKEKILDAYFKIFNFVEKEKSGVQQIASGIDIKLLDYIISHEK